MLWENKYIQGMNTTKHPTIHVITKICILLQQLISKFHNVVLHKMWAELF